MKKIFKILLLISTLSVVVTSFFQVPKVVTVQVNDTQDIKDLNILALVANGVGESYFINKEQLEAWGCTVTTVNCGLTSDVAYCPRKDPRPVTPDIELSEIEDVTEYDCVFIPSGGHWGILSANRQVREFIATAHSEGLVVASICVGLSVVASANIINGTKVAGHPNANAAVEAARGIIVDADVVSDDRVVTAGSGGGVGLGATTAPNHKFCVALVKELLGYSHVINTSLESLSDGSGTGYSISVETTTLSEFKSSLNANSSSIYKVTANVYDVSNEENATFVQSIELQDNDNDNAYNGTLEGLESGEYRVDIEVRDYDDNLEVTRNAATISVSSAVPGWEFSAFISGLALVLCIKKARWWYKIRRKEGY